MSKRLAYLLPAALLLALAAGFLFSSQTLLGLINQSFLAGLFLLLLGSIALVLRSGFFTVFFQGFKQLKLLFSSGPGSWKAIGFKKRTRYCKKDRDADPSLHVSVIVGGAALLMFSVVLTCFYLYQS